MDTPNGTWRRMHRQKTYCAWSGDGPWSLTTGGGFHLPVSASDRGAYSRIVRLNGPLGAGNQFASKSAPGLSFWKYRSSEPSPLYLNGIQLLTANRFKPFATWNPSLS